MQRHLVESRDRQALIRFLPWLGALLIVVIWSMFSNRLADESVILNHVMPLSENSPSWAELFPAASMFLLVLSVAGIALIISYLLRRNYSLCEQLRTRDRDLSDCRVRLNRCVDDLQRVADVAAHDLREPLRRMVAYSQLLMQETAPSVDDEARFCLGQVIDNARRMDSLVKGLGDFISADVVRRLPVRTMPATAVAMARRRLAGVLDAADAVLVVDPLPDVIADPETLTELFVHLIDNAVRFRSLSRRPVIHVSGARDGEGMVVLTVRDNGLGIDPTRVARMFEVFQPGTRADRGGIGLATVRRMVERMGGSVWVTSMPGHDTIFGFSLPAADRGGPAAERRDPARTPGEPVSP